MSFLKSLGWAAAGVAAIVAAPVTGGASLAAIIGAAGTTTAAGAALGALGGMAAKGVYDAATDEPDLASHYRKEAEVNKAAFTEAERKRKDEAVCYKADVERLSTTIADLLVKNVCMLDELRNLPFTHQESELMFSIAAAISYADYNTSREEIEAAMHAVSLLCAERDGLSEMCNKLFNDPPTIDEAIEMIHGCNNKHSLERLGFVLDMVAYADETATRAEQRLLDAVKQHAQLLDQGLSPSIEKGE